MNPALREVVLTDLAYQTYLGVTDFFKVTPQSKARYESKLFPHVWNTDLAHGDTDNVDVLKLQAALRLDQVYPPVGKTENDCGLTGQFGPCTRAAVVAFQNKHGIVPATGMVGPSTRARLNELFGS